MASNPVNEVLQHLRRTELLREGEKRSDAQLLESFVRHRDPVAIEALVRRYGPMVWGVCRRVLANHHDAEDAFQATFLVLVRKAASIRSRELLPNWLYGVAHQTARKARQTTAKRHIRERQVTEMPEPQASSTDPDRWTDLQPLLDEELSRLPDKYRVAIVLCDLQGKSRAEAARQLGLPEGTVGSRLARARTLLAKRLARRGVALPLAALAAVLSQHAVSAAVPPVLLSTTIAAVRLLVVVGNAAAGAISTSVTALTEGVLKAMLLTKLKTVASLVLVAGLVLAGGLFAHHVLLAQQLPSEKVPPRDDDAHPENAAKKSDANRPKIGDRAFALAPGGGVYSAVLSPDGTTLVASTIVYPKDTPDAVSGQRQNPASKIQILDARTGKRLRAIDLDGDQAGSWDMTTSLVFTPDGKGVIGAASHMTPRGLADKNTARLWDITTGKEVRRFTGHPVYVYGVALSKDGKMLATCGGGSYDEKGQQQPGELRLWDAATGKELAQLTGHTKFVLRVAFSPDGVTLASGSHDETVRLWDTKARKEIRQLNHGGVMEGLAFSPDGKQLASIGPDLGPGHRNHLVIWEVATGKEVRELPAGRCVAFSPHGTLLASGGDDKVVHLWEVATGKEVATFTGHTNSVSSVSFSADGTTLVSSGTGDDTVRLWAVSGVNKENKSR